MATDEIHTFSHTEDFRAMLCAEAWRASHGYSVGSSRRGQNRGIMRGDILIAKWRSLTAQERRELHGVMPGDMRHGPVTVRIFAKAEGR